MLHHFLIWYIISQCSCDFHPTFFQTFLIHGLSSIFLQLRRLLYVSTRFTQTHASLHFNECWCNRGSDELAVNQGLVNVNELPIVGVGKVGRGGEMCVCVFVTGCSVTHGNYDARKRDVHRITRSTETHIFCAV